MADDHSTTVVYRYIPYLDPYGTPVDYQAGSDGSIWSALAGGGLRRADGRKFKQLSGCVRSDGYRIVGLRVGGKTFSFLVHRLILATFVGPCPEGMNVCHNNGIKTDNRAENLRYDTAKGNASDKVIHGTLLRGEQIVQSKVTEVDILRIRHLVDLGIHQKLVASVFNLSPTQVCKIVKGLRWKHV